MVLLPFTLLFGVHVYTTFLCFLSREDPLAAQAARSLTGHSPRVLVRLLPSVVPAPVSARQSGVCACVCSQELASSHDPPSGC